MVAKYKISLLSLGTMILIGCGVDILGNSPEMIIKDYDVGYVDDRLLRTIRYQNVQQFPPCVFEVGWNENFIIAKQRQPKSSEAINYYIIDIEKNENVPGKIDQKKGVIGPFTEVEFERKKDELNIPPSLVFTKKYKECE